MTVSVTLSFSSIAAAIAALGALDAATATPPVIAFVDRPDVGAPAVSPAGGSPAEPPLPSNLNAVFNITPEVAAVPVVPTPPAPSTAAAAASPTAPPVPPEVGAATPPAASPPALPPAAPAPAPAAPAAPTPPASGAPSLTLDKAGLPWDHRIHSSTRAIIGDGTWRQKRNLDPALKAQVEAELRQAMTAGVPPGAAPAAPPAPPAAPPAPGAATFSSLMQLISPLIDAGKLTNLEQTTTLGKYQLANLFQLATLEKAQPAVFASIAADFTALAATKA